MSINNKKGFTDSDLWMVRCREDAVKAVQRMTGEQFDVYVKRKSLDIRIKWIVQQARKYERYNVEHRIMSHADISQPDIYLMPIYDKNNNIAFRQPILRTTGVNICGARLKGMPKGWYCQIPAGKGTTHFNYGRCNMHDSELPTVEKKNFWTGLKLIGKAKTFNDFIDSTKDTSEIEQAIDSDLKHLYLIRKIALNQVQKDMDDDDVLPSNKLLNLLKEITSAIVATKKTKHFVESRGMIPATQIPQMIIQILEAVTEGEDVATRQRIVRKAMNLQDDIIFPYIDDPNFVPQYNRVPVKNSMRKARSVLGDGGDFMDAAPKKAIIVAGEYSDEYQRGQE